MMPAYRFDDILEDNLFSIGACFGVIPVQEKMVEKT
jgi:hypothetical protein